MPRKTKPSPEGPEDPITPEQHLTILVNQVNYLRNYCAILLQRLAAANVMGGYSWDNGTQLITAEMQQVEANLDAISARFSQSPN